jgi:hypothetical protein
MDGNAVVFDESLARFTLDAQMRVRVRDTNDNIVFTRNSPRTLLFDRSVRGNNGTKTQADVVSAGLLDEGLTVDTPDELQPEHTIFVRIQYNIAALVVGDAEFVADFDPGGLNIPIVWVNY